MKDKYKVLDTNLFLTDPEALFAFGPKQPDEINHIVIPIEVLDELDKFKREMDTERGANARETLRTIKDLRGKKGGSLYEGIPNNFEFSIS